MFCGYIILFNAYSSPVLVVSYFRDEDTSLVEMNLTGLKSESP